MTLLSALPEGILNLAIANACNPNCNGVWGVHEDADRDLNSPGNCLEGLFDWGATPQGKSFWKEVSKKYSDPFITAQDIFKSI